MTGTTLINAISMTVFGILGLCSFVGVCVGATHQIFIAAMSLSMAYVFYTDDYLDMSVKQYFKIVKRARRIKKA